GADQGLGTLDVPEDVRREAADRLALARYTTDLGGRAKVGTRIDLILSTGPFAQESIDDIDRIESVVRDVVAAEGRQHTQLYIVGATASVRDMAVVMQSDRRWIEILVLISVFAVLIVLLRSLVVPVYLLLSVLFSYFVTMGATVALFWLLDPHG